MREAWRRAAWSGLVVSTVAACTLHTPSANGSADVSASSASGNDHWVIDGCVAEALGVDFLSGGRPVFRATADRIAGDYVELPAPDGSGSVLLRSADCAAWDVEIDDTGFRDGDGHEDFSGKVQARCVLPDQGTLNIDVDFSYCPGGAASPPSFVSR